MNTRASLVEEEQQSHLLMGPIFKQLSLCQVLCKTYKRDLVFAGSMSNLLFKMETQLFSLSGNLTKLDDKKRNYKQAARQFHSEFQNQITKERQEFEEKSAEMQKIIQEQQEMIENLNMQVESAKEDDVAATPATQERL